VFLLLQTDDFRRDWQRMRAAGRAGARVKRPPATVRPISGTSSVHARSQKAREASHDIIFNAA
jgi:hypothetical protein